MIMITMNKVGTRKEDDVEGEAQRGTSFAGRVEMGSSVRKAANQISNPNKQRKTRRKENGKWKMENGKWKVSFRFWLTHLPQDTRPFG